MLLNVRRWQLTIKKGQKDLNLYKRVKYSYDNHDHHHYVRNWNRKTNKMIIMIIIIMLQQYNWIHMIHPMYLTLTLHYFFISLFTKNHLIIRIYKDNTTCFQSTISSLDTKRKDEQRRR